MPIVRQLFRSALATFLPRDVFQVSGPSRSNSICLTFDDGPDPEHTPRILDALRKEGAVATFFVIGEKAARYPEIVRRIAAEGHSIGHHTFTHSSPNKTTARKLLAEIHQTRVLLLNLVGSAPIMFRPPHGKLTIRKLLRLWSEGLSVVLWNVDPRDYTCRSETELRSWFNANPFRSGDVVLLHDNQPHTPGVVGDVIEMARQRRLTLTTPQKWN